LRGKGLKPLVKKDLTSLSGYVILKRLLEEPKVRGSLLKGLDILCERMYN
jgi:hypothetical protein